LEVVQIAVVVRNAPADRNVAMSVVQIFPSAQLDQVSTVLPADWKAQNAETHIAVADYQVAAKVQFALDRANASRRGHRFAPEEQFVRVYCHCFQSDALMVMRRSTELSGMRELYVPFPHQHPLA
jgi:hypothetical protein